MRRNVGGFEHPRIFREIVETASAKRTRSEALSYGFVDIYRIGLTI
jgi:hypothetical protein